MYEPDTNRYGKTQKDTIKDEGGGCVGGVRYQQQWMPLEHAMGDIF